MGLRWDEQEELNVVVEEVNITNRNMGVAEGVEEAAIKAMQHKENQCQRVPEW